MSLLSLGSRIHFTRFWGLRDARCFMSQLGDLGSGAGKGGGGGGSIRDSGGSMGKREAAFEEEYFYKKQREQLEKLKNAVKDEISFHEEQIKRHQEALDKAKQKLTDKEK